MSPTSEESYENSCVVCFKNVEIYSVGECDHPVCYECSTRMRVLCRQNECPICRQDMPKVIFTRYVRPFRDIKTNMYLMDKKFQIIFESSEIQKAYNTLLAHVCSKCPGRHAFQNFALLRDHMRREHELYYCDLCIDNLKILTCERRCYTRSELAQHRRRGDPDDKSHKGHPLCEFCDQRYMDNDELFRHLRRDHLFCHFCDADGFHQFYSSYDYLREHFRKEHYLCEEGACFDEKFTAVFRTEIDLKAHRASVHGRTLGKQATKQARTLELEFTLAPRPRHDNRDPRRNRYRLDYNRDEEEGAIGYNTAQTPFGNQPSRIDTNCIDQFPTLDGTSAPIFRPAQRKPTGLTIRAGVQSGGGLAITDENFPALGPEATVSLRVNSSGTSDRPKSSGAVPKPTNFSIHVNHRPSGPSGMVTIPLQSARNKVKDPFPALCSTRLSAPVAAVASSQWSTGKEADSKIAIIKSKSPTPTQPPPKPPQPKKFHIEDDFPSLSSQFDAGCSVKTESKPAGSSFNKADAKASEAKSKKASSTISIPVKDNWSASNRENSNGNISSDSDLGNKKSGKKKKKSGGKNKGNNSSNNNNINSGSNSTQNSSPTNKSSKNHNNNNNRERKQTPQESAQVEENKNNHVTKKSEGSNHNLERKRSELKIGSLGGQTSPEIKTDLQNFPELSRGKSNAPPGFNNLPKEKPPPGFENSISKSAPPPGFSITLNSVARPPSNGLTFTSSSGQSYPISPGGTAVATKYSYIQPPNFNNRNSELVDCVMAALKDQSALERFRQMSSGFRQNYLTAEDYYNHCQEAMGTSKFSEIFPELLVLLPDIEKQQELWKVYRSSRHSLKPPKLDVCVVCSQVVRNTDLQQHLSAHNLENDFPALANGSAQKIGNTSKDKK